MHIEKINKNKLKVTLNLEDLKKNNISLHSFMCNSTESQSLFFDILNLADEEIGFSIKNCEILIEAFSVPIKSAFVLVFTRIPKVTYLHVSKAKYGTFKAHKSFWIEFYNFDDFCMFCSSILDTAISNSSLFLLDNHYFLHIKADNLKSYFKILAESSEFSHYIYGHDFVLDENSDTIISNSAIKIAKRYFV